MIKYYVYYNNEYNLRFKEKFTQVYYVYYMDYFDTLKDEKNTIHLKAYHH